MVSASLVCFKEHWAFPGGFSAFIMKNKTEERDRSRRGGEDYKMYLAWSGCQGAESGITKS